MSTAETLTLRPRQLHGKKLVHDAWRAGHRRVLYVAPTGSGKRFQIVDWAGAAQRQGKDVLIVTDRRILVKQMHDELYRFGVDYGVIMNEYEENRIPTVQVASIQSLESRYFKDGVGLPPADLVIIDECHKSLDLYDRLGQFYKCFWLGATATPVGAQGRALVPQFYDVMVEGCRNSELISDGLLLPTTIFAPSEPNIAGIKINGGKDFPQEKLGKAVRSVTTFANVFTEWMPFADRKTLVFAPGVAYANGLAYGTGGESDSFKARGIRAEVIEAATKTKDRDRLFDEFENGDLRVLVSVDVLKEGFDAPIASCGIDLQPTAQLRSYWQKLGRVKRHYPGQSDAVWIDMAGNCWRFLHPDEDPDWQSVTESFSSQDVLNRDWDKGKPKPIICPKCSCVRKGGPRCPECGLESSAKDSVRKIRMGNGKLKQVKAEHIKKHEKSEREKLCDKWKGELLVGIDQNRTFEECRNQFARRHKFWPPDDLPFMPPKDSIERRERVADHHTKQEIFRILSFKGPEV